MGIFYSWLAFFGTLIGVEYDDETGWHTMGQVGGNGSFHTTIRTRIGRSRFVRVRHTRSGACPETVLVCLRLPGTPEDARRQMDALPINAYDGYSVVQIEVPTVTRAHWHPQDQENGPAEIRLLAGQ
jgi:hypothetical protein